MRRAIIATAGTIVGLVALLDFKSSGAVGGAGGVPVATGTDTAATSATSSTTSGSSQSTTITGSDVEYVYGDIEVRITVVDGRIKKIGIPSESATDPRSESINSVAIPILTREALAAQSIHFDAVSGATFTSDAFAQSFASALDEEGK